jgi:hypothetical protein
MRVLREQASLCEAEALLPGLARLARPVGGLFAFRKCTSIRSLLTPPSSPIRANHFHLLDAIGNALLPIRIDQREIAKLSA